MYHVLIISINLFGSKRYFWICWSRSFTSFHMLFVAGCPIIDDLNERQGAMLHLEGIQQCKHIVILRDFPSELFGLVIQWPLKKKLRLFGVYAGCKSEIVFLRHHREAFLIKPVWQCCDRSVTPDFFLAKIDAHGIRPSTSWGMANHKVSPFWQPSVTWDCLKGCQKCRSSWS